MLFPLDIDESINSCTKLLSWYSSIAISSNFSVYFFATSVFIIFWCFSPFSSIVSSTSFTKIFRAKCSMSVKSTIFLSLFLFEKISSNSKIKFSSFCSILYISNMSWIHCLESDTKVLSFILLNFFFTLFLIFLASSFISEFTFLVDHLGKNVIFFVISYALSQLFKLSFNVFNCLISVSIICLKTSNSLS